MLEKGLHPIPVAGTLKQFDLKIFSDRGQLILSVPVDESQSIADVKSCIEKRLHVPRRFQAIIVQESEKGDHSFLAEAGLVDPGATATLVKEAVGADALVETLRVDLESLLPRKPLDEGSHEVPFQGADLDLAYGDLGKKEREKRKLAFGFLKSRCSESIVTRYLLTGMADPNFEVAPDVLHCFGLASPYRSLEPDVGGTALHYAARLGRVDVCRELLQDERFDKINLKNGSGRCALHLAAERYSDNFDDGRVDFRAAVCRLLVQDQRCDVNLTQGLPVSTGDEENGEGADGVVDALEPKTALHLAANCDKVVEALLSSTKIDCNLPHPSVRGPGFHPLHGCVSNECCGDHRDMSSLRTCMLLAQRPGIDINARSHLNYTVPEQLLDCPFGHGGLVEEDGQVGLEEEQLAMTVVLEFLRNTSFDVNCHHAEPKPKFGSQPLLCKAAEWGSPDVVRTLLQNERVDPNEKSEQMCTYYRYGTKLPANGQTALHYACKNSTQNPWAAEKIQAVMQCPRFTESVNAQDEFGRSALHIAACCSSDCREGEETPLSALLQNPLVDVNLRDSSGRTALHVLIAKALRDADVRLNFVADDALQKEETAAEALIEQNSLCRLLFNSDGFKVDVSEIIGYMFEVALVEAMSEDIEENAEVIEMIWENPRLVSLDAADCASSATALILAVEDGDVRMCKLLLNDPRFTAVNAKNHEGNSALILALHADPEEEYVESFFEISELLFKDPRVDVNIQPGLNLLGMPPVPLQPAPLLIVARACEEKCRPRDMDFARDCLKDPRTDLNITSKVGATLLHVTCGYHLHSCGLVSTGGNPELCKMLLSNPAFQSVNTQIVMVGDSDEDTLTALHCAVKSEDVSIDIIQMLLNDERTDLNLKDKHGMTAKDWCTGSSSLVSPRADKSKLVLLLESAEDQRRSCCLS